MQAVVRIQTYTFTDEVIALQNGGKRAEEEMIYSYNYCT